MREYIRPYLSKRAIFFIFVIIIIMLGYFTGRITGSALLSRFLTGKKMNSFLIYTPADHYFEIYRLINSGNELDRLSGYYSLPGSGLIDEEFFLERFKFEVIPAARQTIVWLLGQSGERETVKRIFNDIYDKSEPGVKQEILDAVKRMGAEAYSEFIKKHPDKPGISRPEGKYIYN